MYCTLWEECNKTQYPQEVEGKGLKLWFDITVQQKIYIICANAFRLSGQYGKHNSNIFLFHPLGPFPSKMMRCPWILCFDLLPPHCSTQIWRIRYGGSWSIYFLDSPIENIENERQPSKFWSNYFFIKIWFDLIEDLWNLLFYFFL